MNILTCGDDKYTRKMLEKVMLKNPLKDKIFMARDGIEASKVINTIIKNIRFIFITAYIDYAIDSFCVHPYDYILKPIDIEHLEKTLNKLISIRLKFKELKLNKKDANTILPIKQGQKIILLNKRDILFFEKSDKDVLVHTANENFTFKNMSLSKIEDSLESNFFRSHRSFIVNKRKIKEIDCIGNLSYNLKL